MSHWTIVLAIGLTLVLGCGSGGDDAPSATTATVTPTPAPTSPPDAPAIAWAAGVPFARRSDDGGLTWEVSLDRAGGFMWGIDFVDRSHGWVVGLSGIGALINSTSDGGAAWQNQHENIVGDAREMFLRAVHFSDAQHGTAVGFTSSHPGQGLGLALVTTDGGALWSQAPIEGIVGTTHDGTLGTSTFGLYSVCLTDAGLGLAIGFDAARGVVILTRDGGAHWENITEQLPAPAGSGVVSCVGASGFWIVGEDRTLLYSADGGVSWTERSDTAPGSAALQDASFVDASTGWVTACDTQSRRGLVYRTLDGGRTWTERVLVTGLEGLFGAHFAVAFVDDQRGVVVGTDTASFGPFDDQDLLSFATQDGGDTWADGFVPVPNVQGPWDIRDVDLVE